MARIRGQLLQIPRVIGVGALHVWMVPALDKINAAFECRLGVCIYASYSLCDYELSWIRARLIPYFDENDYFFNIWYGVGG